MIPDVLTIPAKVESSTALAGQPASVREFVIGPENAVVVESIVRPFLEEFDVEFSPVFIHGKTGSGKSHLIQSLASFSQRDSMITDANAFSAECTEAIKIDEIAAFEKRYLQCPYLFFDDIDFLREKPVAQQRFTRILDFRTNTDKATIITAKLPPTSLKLPIGLVSRLSQGIVVPLEYPTAATREHLLRVFANRTGLSLDNEAISQLAQANNAAPALLNQLMSLRIGRASVNQLAAEHDEVNAAQSNVDPKKLIRVTAAYYGLKPHHLSGSSRRKQHVMARSMAMFLLRKTTSLSFHDIGQLFGRRDHSTVMHACRKIEILVGDESTTENAKSEILSRFNLPC